MYEIRSVVDNSVIATGNDLIDAVLKNKRKLAYANLRRTTLVRIGLHCANLSDADLSGADLSGSYLSGSDLSGSNLEHTCFAGADLRYVNLDHATINFNSHALISRILLYAAGHNIDRRMIAGLIHVSDDWCWSMFLGISHPEKDWAIKELKKWVKPGQDVPEILKS